MTTGAPLEQAPPRIKVAGLSKSYGVKPVLRGLDLEVAAGQRFVLFGGNGSGKTTLLKCLAGLARPDAGNVTIAGRDARRQGPEARRLTGVVTHQPLLYEDMTGQENLDFYGRMFQMPHVEERIQQVAAQLNATPLLSARVRTLSHGMKKRLSLCRALLHNPRVLLLDEPETGLDEEALRLLDAALTSEEGRRRTVLMATHSLERGLALADRVGILAGGRIAYQAEAKALDLAGFRQAYSTYLGAAP